MALQVWLPLNGSLKNCGLNDDITASNGGGTSIDNAGRIGKCYNINNGYISIPAPLSTSTPNFTICAWVYVSSLQGGYGPIYDSRTAAVGKGVVFWITSTGFRLDDGSAYQPSFSHTANTWMHVCWTRNSTEKKIYVNGNLIGTGTSGNLQGINTTAWIGKDQKNPSTYYFNGKINDFRLYDNCLSPEDVKHLYQTKIWDIMPYTHMGREFLFDRSGYGLMPLVNTGTTWHGNALYFDGSSRMRPKAGNVGFNLTGGTMSVWFTPKVIPSDYRIIFIDSTSKFGLGFYNSTSLLCVSNINSTTYKAIIPVSFTAGKLQNVTVSYDSSYNDIKCYVNGTAVATTTSSRWLETEGLTVGGRTYNTTSWFNGKIHKVDIFKNQLTAAECIELYNKERTNFLPDEYVQLEYIQSTGTQYIDTGINPCMNKIRCVCDVAPLNGNDTAFFGSRGTYFLFYYLNGNYFWPTSKCETIEGTLQVGEKYHVDWNKGTLKVTGPNGVKQIGVRSNNTQDTRTMYIFNFNPTDSRAAVAKLYNFGIYIDDCIVRNFIPVKRKSDNVIGLYDMVTKKFFTNAGTGTFTAGPEW